MIVMKFGGSSIANAERLRHILGIVSGALDRRPVLVLSAMGDTTDHLLEAAKNALEGSVSIGAIAELHSRTCEDLELGDTFYSEEIEPLLFELRSLLKGISLIKEFTPRTNDYLVSFGERLSVRIAAAYFKKEGLLAEHYDSWDIGFLSNADYGSADLEPSTYKAISATLKPKLKAGKVPVVTGFIAKDASGAITTLGRGGSDLSATVIGAACGAEEVQVWKDVDGILSADPRLVKSARPIEQVTFEEASEMAYFGSQVLHPRAMQPCIQYGTPVRVKNSYNPAAVGTRILASLEKGAAPLRTITTKRKITLIDIVSSRMLGQYGFLARVFDAFEMHKISVDMVATSEVSLSLTLDEGQDLNNLIKDLEQIAKVGVQRGKAIITLIGDISRSSEILAKTFSVCANKGVQVQMISQGASKVNISFIVDDGETTELIRALHEDFFSGGEL